MIEISNPATGEVRTLKDQVVEHYPGPFSMGPHKIRNILLANGEQRVATCSDKGADTFFSIPCKIKYKGKTISGYATRETINGFTTYVDYRDPEVWKFVGYGYGRNGHLIKKQPWVAA